MARTAFASVWLFWELGLVRVIPVAKQYLGIWTAFWRGFGLVFEIFLAWLFVWLFALIFGPFDAILADCVTWLPCLLSFL